jgi:hypothetical protein
MDPYGCNGNNRMQKEQNKNNTDTIQHNITPNKNNTETIQYDTAQKRLA